jgi:hypothetical protein
MVEVPLPTGNPNFRIEVELDEGRTYFLNIRWNERAGAWFLAIDDADGTRLVSCIRLVVNWPLFARFTDARLPRGSLALEDSQGEDKDPGLADLGSRVRMYYVTADDFAAIGLQ